MAANELLASTLCTWATIRRFRAGQSRGPMIGSGRHLLGRYGNKEVNQLTAEATASNSLFVIVEVNFLF